MPTTPFTPANPAIPPFHPVPVRARRDGWLPARQLALIEALAACGCVEEACKCVGLSVASAYALRNRAEGSEFRARWDLAMELGLARRRNTPAFVPQSGFDARTAVLLMRHHARRQRAIGAHR